MSILENIIWPLKPDIFVTTWDDQPSYDFCNFYKPVKRRILNFEETMDHLGPTDKLPCQPGAGLIPMTAGLKILNTMVQDHMAYKKKEYDLIIRLRPDVEVLEQIKVHEIKDCAKNKHIRLPLFESTNIYNHEDRCCPCPCYLVSDGYSVGSLKHGGVRWTSISEVGRSCSFFLSVIDDGISRFGSFSVRDLFLI